MDEPFDFRETSSQILMRMSKHQLKNVWMIAQLRDAGIEIGSTMFSKVIRNVIQTERAKQILEACDKILDNYERLYVDRMKQSRESGLSPNGMEAYEIIYDFCPEDGGTGEEHGLTEIFTGTWQELQNYTKEMQKTGCYNIHANAVMPPAGIDEEPETDGQNLPAEDPDKETKQRNRENADSKGSIFEYEGYHFEPVGTYEKSERAGFWKACAADMYVVDAFMEDEPGANPIYVKDFFYASAQVPEDEVNLFRCIETGKILAAGESSLFVYTDPVREDEEYTPDSRESKEMLKTKQSETEETAARPAVSGPRRRGR